MNLMGMCDAPRCRIRVTDFNPSGIQFGQIVSLFSLSFFFIIVQKKAFDAACLYTFVVAHPRENPVRE